MVQTSMEVLNCICFDSSLYVARKCYQKCSLHFAKDLDLIFRPTDPLPGCCATCWRQVITESQEEPYVVTPLDRIRLQHWCLPILPLKYSLQVSLPDKQAVVMQRTGASSPCYRSCIAHKLQKTVCLGDKLLPPAKSTSNQQVSMRVLWRLRVSTCI